MKATDHGLKQLCRELYFKYRSAEEIIRQTGVKRATLRNWVHGRTTNDPKSWRFIRDQERMEIVKEEHARKIYKIEKLTSISIDLIHHSIIVVSNELAAKGKEAALNWKQMQALTDIITATNKLKRLEEGEPTDIHGLQPSLPGNATKAATIIELRNAFLKDPFMRKGIEIKEEAEHGGRTDTIEVSSERVITSQDLESSDAPGPLRGDSRSLQDDDRDGQTDSSSFDDSDLEG